MDYYSCLSCVAKRTRFQTDLYFKNIYDKIHGTEEDDSMKSTEYQVKKSKKRKFESRDSDPGVFLGEFDGERREGDGAKEKQGGSVFVGSQKSKSNLDKGKGIACAENKPFEVIEIDESEDDEEFDCYFDPSWSEMKFEEEPVFSRHDNVVDVDDEQFEEMDMERRGDDKGESVDHVYDDDDGFEEMEEEKGLENGDKEKDCDSVEAESSGLRTPIEASVGFDDVICLGTDHKYEDRSVGCETRENGVKNDGDNSQGVSSRTRLETGCEKKKDKEISESDSDFDFMSSSDSMEANDSDDEDYCVGKFETSDSMEENSSFYDDDDDDDDDGGGGGGGGGGCGGGGGGEEESADRRVRVHREKKKESVTQSTLKKREKKVVIEYIDTGSPSTRSFEEEDDINTGFCTNNGETKNKDHDNGESSDGGGANKEAFEKKTENENAGLSISSRKSEEEEEGKGNQSASRAEGFSGGNNKKKLESEDIDMASSTAGREEVEKGKDERNVNGEFCKKNGETNDEANKSKFEEEKVSENASSSFSGSKSKENDKRTFFSMKKTICLLGKNEKRLGHGNMDRGNCRPAFMKIQKKIEDDDANKEECRAKKENKNEGLLFCERKTEEERGTQSSSHIPRAEFRKYHKDGESSTKVFEEKEAEEEKKAKEEKEDKTNDKYFGGGAKKEEHEEQKMSWKGQEFGSKRKRFKVLKDYDVFRLLANSIWEKGELLNDEVVVSEEKAPEQEAKPPVVEEQLPLKFTFGIEEPEPVEKSEFEKELDKLWDEMEFALKSCEIGSHTAPMVNAEVTLESGTDSNLATLCRQGKHSFVLDEEIGIKCIYCSLVDVEIRYVPPHMEKFPFPSEAIGKKTSSSEDDVLMFDGLPFQASGSKSEDSCNQKEGTVWDIIPGIRESMYSHQQEGFEFIWKNLAGTIELDKSKSSDSNDVGGCIISHAPGTGKTRLTIIFLQTYLELFPKCRPVIIAPAGILFNWEEEFKKWNIGIPFHNLNNLEFSGKENMAAVEILEGNRHHSQSYNAIRMVKLFTWSTSKSILGISYSLYEKLAGEKIDKKTKKKRKAVLDRESEELRKILLEMPGLLVLDEGHTPRNQRSCIWKVLSKLQTQKRIILSGTPFQNNFIELCNTLCLVRPAFADMNSARLKNFCQKRRMPKRRGRRKEQASLSSPVDIHAPDDEIKELRTLMAPFVHVHKGSILQKNLPGLRDCVVMLNPPNLQKRLLENLDSSQNTFIFEHKLAVVSVHPSLFLCCSLSKTEESVIGQDQEQQLDMLKHNPYEGVKTRFLIEFVRLCEAIKEKVLVVSQFIDPLSLIIAQLNSKFSWSEGKEILHMHGKLDLKQRQLLINIFNDPNSQAKILLASTKACSEGISLVGASRVILLDVVWNPSVERQAISRAYRLGQKRVVYTYHLITHGTAEYDKYCKQAEKDRISELVFSSSKKENDKRKIFTEINEDKILEEMVRHDSLKDMFDKIIYQPKESDLVESFGSVALEQPWSW